MSTSRGWAIPLIKRRIKCVLLCSASLTIYLLSVWHVYVYHRCCYCIVSLRIIPGLCIERINHVMCPSALTSANPAMPLLLCPSLLIPWTAGPLCCWDYTLEVSRPLLICRVKAKASKYSTFQGISMDYRHNHESNRSLFTLLWRITKSLYCS